MSLMLFAAATSQAQTPNATLIETTGEATITQAPAHAEFWVHLVASADQFHTSMEAAEQFERKLREALAAKSITPNEIMVTAPAIASVNEPLIDISARLRYSMTAYKSAETGAKLFATLCDGLHEVASRVGTSIEGPLLQVQDEKTVIRSAVTKATENAYSPAEAIATELKSSVFAVASVSVADIVWNRAPGRRGAQPSINEVSCTATVRVVYEVLPRN
jgi:uncharacterized protein YggE